MVRPQFLSLESGELVKRVFMENYCFLVQFGAVELQYRVVVVFFLDLEIIIWLSAMTLQTFCCTLLL